MTDSEIGRIGYDPEAFEVFYRAHVAAIGRFVARRVDDPYLVADLTTEVFMAAVSSARSSPVVRGEPITWLYGIARNVVNLEWRRQAREKRAVSKLAGMRPPSSDNVAQLEARIDAESKARELYKAMADLSDAERAVIELVGIDGLSVRDAATALGIGAVAARMRLHRARKQLKQQLAADTTQLEVSEALS